MIAVVAGGTGLIGNYLLEMLEASDSFVEVRALSRHSNNKNFSKIKWVTTTFDNEMSLINSCSGTDVIFCCLGTTMKKAGSKEAFRGVDFDYVIRLARAAKSAGCKRFLVVSAVGASSSSSVFYSRVKGEVEEALQAIGFDLLIIAQPGALIGPRKEFRFGEKIGIFMSRILSPFLIGSLQKYRPVHARVVAEALMLESLKGRTGRFVLEYPELKRAASAS